MRRRDFVACAAASPLLLADEAQSPYTICLSRDASPSEQRAAAELRQFIRQMTGAELPIRPDNEQPPGPLILLGQNRMLERTGAAINFDSLGAEGFLLRTAGEHVIIAGGRKRGTMYGAYELLEKLGCRWYARDCSVVPRRTTLHLPALNEEQRPAYEYREPHITEAYSRDFAARSRTNGNFSELDESTGGKVVYYPFGHSFGLLIPPSKYWSEHPEYFALVNGERRFERSQICLTNPDVVRISSAGVKQWMKEHPEASIFSVSSNDADNWCECENCLRVEAEEGGAHSGPIIRFVNAIAAETSKTHPDLLIDTFAYRYCENAPSKTGPHPNVRVRMALSGACQAHPYEQCPHNADIMSSIRGWARLGGKTFVWQYMVNFHQYLAAYPNLDQLTSDLSMYPRYNVTGLFLQGGGVKGGGSHLAELRAYLLAKLLWNPKADSKALTTDFLRAYYGPAAPAMEQYLDLIHGEMRLPPKGKGKTLWMYRGPNFEPATVDESRKLFSRMLDSVANNSTKYGRRVEQARLGIDWIDLMEAKRFVLKDGRYGPADPALFWKRYTNLVTAAKSYGIQSFTEQAPIEDIEPELRTFVRRHDTVTLENEWLAAIVAPTYHGRVVQLIHRKRGINGVREGKPIERFTAMEMLGGIILWAHTELYSRPRYDISWTVENHVRGRELVLKGVCGNGLEFRRVLRLSATAAVLETITTATNAGAKAFPLTLQSRGEVNPGLREVPTIHVAWQDLSGKKVGWKMLPTDGANQGDMFFRDQQRPNGEWRLTGNDVPVTLINRFPVERIERCRLYWRARGQNQFALSLWSKQVN
ncbi:MAG: DUF4838 domain-containing protein, partial [Acidobacteria bacterium]|nr:DUF4838 domain-containing protein [Acidobacteriota bacterium]